MSVESGRVTKTYRYHGSANQDGEAADLYEIEQHRFANKYSGNGMVQVHFIRKTRYWFLKDGKYLRKIEENEFADRKELSRETSNYKYDPAIKIKPPVVREM